MIEPQDNRRRRLEDGSPLEIIETLLNSIHNSYNWQIDAAIAADAWDLAFVGMHSVAVTIGAGLFAESPLTAFAMFLKKFVDTDQVGQDFSRIAGDLHSWRNVLIHRWLSERGYKFGFDMEQDEGWRKVDDVVLLNPRLYHEAFNSAFRAGGKIWDWQRLLTDDEAQAAKTRLLKQYDLS